MAAKTTDFTSGKIYGPLIRFMIPVLCAMLLQVMYGAVDLIVVGRFAETADVSAVSTGSQITQSVTSIIIGLAMGTTVLLGQNIGLRKLDEAGNVIGGGIILFGILAAIITVVVPVCAAPLARLMKAPAEAFDQTVAYVRICMLGAVFIVSYNLLCSIFRGIGDSKTPLMAVAIACVFNVTCDILLVSVFHLGSVGVAIATVGAQAVSVVICLLVLRSRQLPFHFSKANIRFHKNIIRKTIVIGAPLALQDFLVSVSFLVMLAIVNNLGVIVSAGVGVAQKISGFVMLIPSSMSQSISVFTAQNFGAANVKRASRGLIYGMVTAFAISVVIFVVAFFRGDLLARLFANDPEVIAAAFEYLKAYAIDALLTSFMFSFNGYFTGTEKTGFVMFHGIFSAFCIRIPMAYLMSKCVPVNLFHVALATPASTLVQCVLCLWYFNRVRRELEVKEAARAVKAAEQKHGDLD